MQKVFKFICCDSYDFMDNGKRISGISVKCFDEESNKIIKAKAQHMLDLKFGDEILVECIPNGRYINYVVA